MNIRVAIIEKLSDGRLETIDERLWDEVMMEMLHHVNYLLVQGNEYEMIEGRLNVDQGTLELLVMAAKD